MSCQCPPSLIPLEAFLGSLPSSWSRQSRCHGVPLAACHLDSDRTTVFDLDDSCLSLAGSVPAHWHSGTGSLSLP
eukprot:1109012-Rhodomonas_salina.1